MIFYSPSSGFVWVRLCLGRVFLGLVRVLVKFWTRGPKELTESQSLPFFCSESIEHGPGTSLRNSGIFSGENSGLVRSALHVCRVKFA